MARTEQRFEGMTAAIFGLWRNWAIAFGVLTALVLISPLVPRPWLLPIYVLAYLLFQSIRFYLRYQRIPSCARFLREMSVILVINIIAVALVAVFGHGEEMYNFTGQPYTAQTPFIAVLVAAPTSAMVTLWFMMRRREPMICANCKRRFGNIIEHGFIGDLYRREWLYQTRLLFTLCLLVTVISWGYCLTRFVNVNLNRADYFYFIWMPLAIYVLSLLYLGMRYYTLWVYYCQNDEANEVNAPAETTLRFLILHHDQLLLSTVKTDQKLPSGARAVKFDTPAVMKIAYHDQLSLPEAERQFAELSGIDNAKLRLIYESPDAVTYHNIFHYFVFVDSSEVIADSKLQGEWFSRSELRQLIIQGLMARDLNVELNRIYTVAMAWKTYDTQGRRLYPIRNYRPTFRLHELRDWDVDYNDEVWLRVSRRNQDKVLYPMYRMADKLASKLGLV